MHDHLRTFRRACFPTLLLLTTSLSAQENDVGVPDDYERKQTLVNAERYVTPALKDREEEIVNAQEKMQRLEYDLFVELRGRIAREAKRIHDTAAKVATLDTLLSLADVAVAKTTPNPSLTTRAKSTFATDAIPCWTGCNRAGSLFLMM